MKNKRGFLVAILSVFFIFSAAAPAFADTSFWDLFQVPTVTTQQTIKALPEPTINGPDDFKADIQTALNMIKSADVSTYNDIVANINLIQYNDYSSANTDGSITVSAMNEYKTCFFYKTGFDYFKKSYTHAEFERELAGSLAHEATHSFIHASGADGFYTPDLLEVVCNSSTLSIIEKLGGQKGDKDYDDTMNTILKYNLKYSK